MGGDGKVFANILWYKSKDIRYIEWERGKERIRKKAKKN